MNIQGAVLLLIVQPIWREGIYQGQVGEMRTIERWPDGLAFEQMYNREVIYFRSARTGVNDDRTPAALILRAEGRTELLKLLHEEKIEPVGPVDFDFDEVTELIFKVV